MNSIEICSPQVKTRMLKSEKDLNFVLNFERSLGDNKYLVIASSSLGEAHVELNLKTIISRTIRDKTLRTLLDRVRKLHYRNTKLSSEGNLEDESNLNDFLEKVRELEATIEQIKLYGKEMYSTIFVEPIHSMFQRTIGAAKSTKRKILLRLQFREGTEALSKIPWELFFDEWGEAFFVYWGDVNIVREVLRPQSNFLHFTGIDRPIKVLGLISALSSDQKIKAEKEELEKILAASIENADISIDWVDASLSALRKKLNSKKTYDIFHFMGRNSFKNNSTQENVERLIFKDREGNIERIDAKLLSRILSTHETLFLAVMDIRGEDRKVQNQFVSSFEIDLQKNVFAVLSFQLQITDDFRRNFFKGFYGQIGFGSPIDSALFQARLSGDSDSFEWVSPTLFMQSGPNSTIL